MSDERDQADALPDEDQEIPTDVEPETEPEVEAGEEDVAEEEATLPPTSEDNEEQDEPDDEVFEEEPIPDEDVEEPVEEEPISAEANEQLDEPEEDAESDEQFDEAEEDTEPDEPEGEDEEFAESEGELAPVVAESEPDAVVVPEAAEEEEDEPSRKRWYAVKVQSGRENTIRSALERRVRIEGLEEYIGRILIPTEKQTVLRKTKTKNKDGEEKIKEKRVTREVKKYPGYLFVEVEFNDQVLYLFRETTGVGDFVGGSFNRIPTPMTDREVQRMLAEAGILKPKGEEGKEPELVLDFQVGDRVKIRHGSFKDQEGEVKEIIFAKDEKETTKVRVELTIFGRPVPLEIEPWHVEVV